KFADESIRFVRAVTPASWTLPAHASLLTGLEPGRHGATDPRVRMSDSVETIAAALGSRYETVGFVDTVYLASNFGLDRGFSRYGGSLKTKEPLPEGTGATDPSFARAIDFVSNRPPSGKPLFLFVQDFMVHDYYADALIPDDRPGDEAMMRRNLDWV